MDTQSIGAYIELLRSELGFRALVDAGPYTPMYGLYGGLEMTIQHEDRRPIWRVAVPPRRAPAVAFFLAPRDGDHGFVELLTWGGAVALGEPELERRFSLRSWSKEKTSALFAQAAARHLLQAPCLYSLRVSKSVMQVDYRDQPGPPREALVAMLEHTRALVASVSGG